MNEARRGILALVEWIGMGELRSPDRLQQPDRAARLGGANGVGLFYLAMCRGLDYLYDDLGWVQNAHWRDWPVGRGWQTML